MYSWCHGISECQSLHDCDIVETNELKNAPKNSRFSCLDANYTQLRVIWPYSVTIHNFTTVLTDPAYSSWFGFFTARWQWQHLWAARARNSKRNTRASINELCLHMAFRAVNGFKIIVCLAYIYDIKARRHFVCVQNGITQLGNWCRETWQHIWTTHLIMK